jgi:hypothetical protein
MNLILLGIEFLPIIQQDHFSRGKIFPRKVVSRDGLRAPKTRTQGMSYGDSYENQKERLTFTLHFANNI